MKSKITYALAIFLSWLGLAGIADNFVERRDWFEVGIMQHWRFFKGWLIYNVFWWLPFAVPSWVIDYFCIGVVVFRSSLHAFVFGFVTKEQDVEYASHASGVSKQLAKTRAMAQVVVVATLASAFLSLFWPLVAPLIFYGAHLNEQPSENSASMIAINSDGELVLFTTDFYRRTRKLILVAIGLFIPALFLFSDLVGTW